MKSHMKFNNNLIRGSSIANIINDSIKLVPQAILLEDLSLIQGEYANVFNSVSTESALTSILIFRVSLQYEPPEKKIMPP